MQLIMYIDGASRGNPGRASVGIVVADFSGNVLREVSRSIGKGTNNQAEYRALLCGLDEIDRMFEGSSQDIELLVRSDSQLLCRQLSGEYRVKNGELVRLSLEVMRRARKLAGFRLECIPREENRYADELANAAFRGQSG